MRFDPTIVSDADIMSAARELQHAHGASILAKAARRIRRAWAR